MNKTAIKKFAIEARNKLRASVIVKAGMLGITEEECSSPITKGTDFEIYKTAAGTEVTLNRSQCEQRRKLVDQINARGFDTVIEEVAYTWFNRICAIRFMEVNDYLPSRVRVLSSEKAGKTEPDIVTQAPDVDLDFTDKEREFILDAKMNNNLDELFRRLFIKQCNKLSEILPELFEATEDYTEMLLNISYTNEDDIVRMLVGEGGIPEEDFNIQVSGQVEIIGWLYQYYNEERKNEVINIYKGTVKKEDIPAATQLFTTDWVVRYMVDNSLGRYWIERNPESKLKEKLEFFVTPKSGEINYVNEKVEPTDLTFLDPCMGSGHILVYAFDVLMEIYRECGYSDRDAAINIVQHNLYGLDIDDRAYQLAYFAVMMKARSYNRRALTLGIMNNLCAIKESNTLDKFECGSLTPDSEQNEVGQYLINKFKDAKELGSLISVEKKDYKSFEEYMINIQNKGQMDIFQSIWINETHPIVLKFIKQARVLSNKYSVVATNPPYLGKMQGQLKKFVTDNYKEYSGDLFAVFMYRNFEFCVKRGYSAFMTPFVWMFIKTYEQLRKYIINSKALISLIQMEYSAFEEATVPICSFILKNEYTDNNTLCFRLSEFKGGMDIQKQKVLEALEDKHCGYFYENSQSLFARIPGTPIAYWVGEKIVSAFESNLLGDYAYPKQGFATGNNDRFLRFWNEVSIEKIGWKIESRESAQNCGKKWFPCNKGGGFRRWYGNNVYIANWENDGEEMTSFSGSVIRNPQFYFQKGITWSSLTSGKLSMRYSPTGFLFESKGSVCFFKDEKYLWYILGLMNTEIVSSMLLILSPTLDYHEGPISRVPVIVEPTRIARVEELVKKNVELCKQDWDSFEYSWDYKKHPLIQNVNRVEDAFVNWQRTCNERFALLKSNEEELNRIFIEVYNLKGELSYEVEDKDITVNKAELQREIKGLISYAVGCMFGRYSLDVEGLVYAGGTWIANKYSSYMPDKDNCLPITDEEYFGDDIVGRFVEFIKVVYGEKDLEENLEFIARSLGVKGQNSREIIRNYFLNDFMTDHLKLYQKRPIYWMFDGGKSNGFKALVYLHRYNADTVGTVRTEYLHKTQVSIETALKSAEYVIENASGSEKSRATKLITKYTKQLAEIKQYDEAMAHIANQRIELDLDDGVKVNYDKFQGIEVTQEGRKTQKIDLLTKIK